MSAKITDRSVLFDMLSDERDGVPLQCFIERLKAELRRMRAEGLVCFKARSSRAALTFAGRRRQRAKE